MLNKFAFVEVHNIYDCDLDFLTSWWHWAKLSHVSSTSRHSSPDFIVINYQIFNNHRKICKRLMKTIDSLFYSLNIWRKKSILVFYKIL